MPESKIEKLCEIKGIRMTNQRRLIAQVLSDAEDHPNVEEVHRRVVVMDPGISIATVYRTVKLLEETGILDRHDFKDGRSRYEEATDVHHDHLVNLEDGSIIEFTNQEIEALQERIAREHGLRLVDHRLELYGVPLNDRDE
ncbi:MAG TPA: transcriptional repressor [Rhodospirillaceae bacterium]|nr:transcriptional repressor [Rhodospirillaceae bacterium]HAA91212.1 transcriptional repressor [Rhodospirillaceae bacterium]HAT36135.1 transcriptional repressor [Rhodospirillaceae bacterium]